MADEVIAQDAPGVDFGSQLAVVVFGDDKMRPCEENAVSALQAWFDGVSDEVIRSHIERVDLVVGQFGPSGVRAVGELVQARKPWVLPLMPGLAKQEDHLRRAQGLAQLFSSENLKRLSKALAEEGVRQ